MPAVEINLIWFGKKELPDDQEKKFQKLIENNKPPSVVNVWTDKDSQPNFEKLLTKYRAQGLTFNIIDINTLKNEKTESIFDCVEVLFRPNRYYSAMGDYFKTVIMGRPLAQNDVPFRIYSEFDDVHPEAGFSSMLSMQNENPPIMWRFTNVGAIEPDFLAINMASDVGQLSAQYLVSFTAKICALKKSNDLEQQLFVVKGVDADVIRRYVGEHLNYSLIGLRRSMERTNEFKNGFNFGKQKILGTLSERKSSEDNTHSSWESVMVQTNAMLRLYSPECRRIYHNILLGPYDTVIGQMLSFGADYLAKQKAADEINLKSSSPSSPISSSSGMFKPTGVQKEPKEKEPKEKAAKEEESNNPLKPH